MNKISKLGIPKVRALGISKIKSVKALGLESNNFEEDYENDFYGLKKGEGVDFPKLIRYLQSYNKEKLNYNSFKGMPVRERKAVSRYGVVETGKEINKTIAFKYVNEYKQEVDTSIDCGINKKLDDISDIPYFSLYVNFREKKIHCVLSYFYVNTEKYRQSVVNTASENDFIINDKYIGVKLSSDSISDMSHLVRYMQRVKANEENFWYETLVNKTYIPLLEKAGSKEELIWLYENAADFTLRALKPEQLWKHICEFYNYDTKGIFSYFKDASLSLIRALFAFNTPDRISFLMKKLNENQEFVKKIYDALDGTMLFEGKEQKLQTIFSSLMTGFCFADVSTLHFTNEIFYVGKDYFVNVKNANNEAGKYWVEQRYKSETYYIDSGTAIIEMGGEQVLTNRIKLNPLDIVTLLQKDTDSLLFVPVLFLKDIDHQKDLENLMTAVRIGVDILAIALTISTLGGASPLLAVAGALEIGLAVADIAVMTNKDKLSEEFLKTWEKIYIIGGLATASPVVVSSLYKLGGKILASSAKAEMKNFVQSCMMKMLLESEISNLSKNTVKILKTNTELVESTKGTLTEFKAKTLNKYGLLIIEGEFKTGKNITKEAALVYKGEIILHADRYDFFNKSYPLLKNINHEKEFIKLADELLVYGKEYPVIGLKPLITEAQAMSQYGNAGKALVNAVDNEVQHILQTFYKDVIEEKVMVCGLMYKKSYIPKSFTATNFLKEEIAKGKGKLYLDFIKNLHPTLQIRLDKHIAKLKMSGVLASKSDLLRAGKMGSHGEIRALDKLLKEIDPQGKLGESVFQDIIGYNRFLREGAKEIQPPCVHCFYLTSGIKFIGF